MVCARPSLILFLCIFLCLPSAMPSGIRHASAAEQQGASRGLAGIKDFERFKAKYMGLSKNEQIIYATQPYFIITNNSNELGDSKKEVIKSHAALAKKIAGWGSLFPTTAQLDGSGWSVVTMNASQEKAEVCLVPAKDGPCLSRYDFIFMDDCWRITGETVEDSGI